MTAFTDDQERDIETRYRNREPLRRIAVEYRTSDHKVKQVLATRGVPLRSSARRAAPIPPDTLAAMIARYRVGEGLATLARDFHVSIRRLGEILPDAGVIIRPQHATRFSSDVEAEITRRYCARESHSALAKE